MPTLLSHNPFRYDRLPDDSAFFDREEEVGRIVKSITKGENLLVRGLRRMGKTSCLLRAARTAANEHNAVTFFADLRRYATLADLAQGLLSNAVPALGSLGARASTWLASTVKGILLKPAAKGSLNSSALGGPDLEVELSLEVKAAPAAVQVRTFTDVLDALNTLAGEQKKPVAVILDEFTFLDEMGLGADKASWQLRSTIQRHQHITYILAASSRHLIDRLHGSEGPFYGMFGRLEVKAIDPVRFSGWIDSQFVLAGITADRIGETCIRLVGERTRDILQLARRCFDLAAPSAAATPTTVEAALASLIEDSDSEFFDLWAPLAPLKKTILRIISDQGGTADFTAATIAPYGLHVSSSIGQACRDLMRMRSTGFDNRTPFILRISEHPAKYTFDNPFFAAWVKRLEQARPYTRNA
jgi:hypothetical protein